MTDHATKESGPRLEAARAPPRPAPRRRAPYPKLSEASEDPEARRLCAIILEVLGGARTPTDAAGAVGVSVPRYYALEARALRGLLGACQRRSRGRRRSAESELVRLKGDVDRLSKERDRLQALLRASQRTMGLPAPKKPERSTKKRRRRPAVRALKASRSLGEPRAENALEGGRGRREDAVGVKG